MNEDRRRPSFARLLVRFAGYTLTAASILIATAGVLAFLAYEHVTQPDKAIEEVRVDIPEGATGKYVGRILAAKDLVEHELLFRLAVRLDESGRCIKHGRYVLGRGLSPSQLLDELQEGPNQPPSPEELPDELKLTIPEGLTIRQMARLFDDEQAFVEAACDPALLARIGVDAPTLEGFLMPDTYFFDCRPEPREAVQRMIAQFEKEYAALLEEFPEAVNRDKLEIATIASLIEEEARVDEERPLIGAVIYNRLERNRRLEMDATLQYALDKYGQRLLNEDKETESPYNTYKYAGLPPGPISNPGVASLRAAMNPADVDYLYFVSNADGATHTFSRTIAEHTQAVRRYRRQAAAQRREIRNRKFSEAAS